MPIPIRERGYPHPELLAETDWLAGRLSDPTVRVVDARSDKDYASGHIPGAVHINGFSLGGIRPEPEMPEPEAFAQLVGGLGIDECTPVVVYDAGERSQMAGMTAWTFLYYGHPDIRYLDGGLAKWTGQPRGCRCPSTPRACRLLGRAQCRRVRGNDEGVECSAPARAPAGGHPLGIHRAFRCRQRDVEVCRRAHNAPGGYRDHAAGHGRYLLRGRCARGSRSACPKDPGVTTGHRTTPDPLTNGPISLTPRRPSRRSWAVSSTITTSPITATRTAICACAGWSRRVLSGFQVFGQVWHAPLTA